MSQRRYFSYKDDDRTDWLNRQYMGIMPAGLYTGFDKDASSAGTNLVLSHLVNGYSEVDVNSAPIINLGLVRTQQGVVVIEDASVNVSVTANNVANPRIDIVVCEHTYDDVTVGGVTASYTVITGTASATPVAPALTFPNNQVIIGTINWPANTAVITGTTYVKADCPIFANATNIVITNLIQTITARKKFQHIIGSMELAAINSTVLTFVKDSNFYYLPFDSTDYDIVSDISVPFTGDTNYFRVITDQDIIIDNTSGKFLFKGGAVKMHIPAGTSFDIIDISAGLMTSITSAMYYIVSGNEPKTDSSSKLFAQLVFNKGTDLTGGVLGQIAPDFTGNYYEVTINHSVSDLKSILGANSLRDGVNGKTVAGNVIILRLLSSLGIGNSVTIKNNTGTITGDYRHIITPTGADISVQHGAYVTLLEDEANWVILSIIDSTCNPITLRDAIAGIPALIAATEQNRSKIETTGWAVLPTGNFDTSTGILNITDAGNSFQIDVPPADVSGIGLKDIKIKRGIASPVDLPDGTIINVRFKHTVFVIGVSEPFYIDSSGTNMLLPFADLDRAFGASATTLHLLADTTTDHDVFIFRRGGGKWDALATNFEKHIYQKIRLGSFIAPTITGANWATDTVAPSPIKYRIDGFGIVSFTGGLQATSTTPANAVFTLLVGFRPVQFESFPLIHNVSGGTGLLCEIQITTAGVVSIKYGNSPTISTGVAGSGFPFSNVRFQAVP